MSLRVDIHDAIAEVAGDERAMAARVVAAMLVRPALSRTHRRRRWTAPLRGIASLVAVLLGITLIVGLLSGGRVLQDWHSYSAKPQPSPNVDMALVAQLEARPLDLHTIPAGAECPTGPYSAYSGYGSGPVSLIGGLVKHSNWGNYFNSLVYTDVRLTGYVIGRGLDLKTGHAVVFIGNRAIGPAVGTDNVERNRVQQHGVLLLDTDHPPATITDYGKLRVWGIPVGLDWDSSGCTGFQFDGTSFSQTFVVSGGWGGVTMFWPQSENG